MHVSASVFLPDPLLFKPVSVSHCHLRFHNGQNHRLNIYLQILNLHSEMDWSSPFVPYAAAPSLESAATGAFLAS